MAISKTLEELANEWSKSHKSIRDVLGGDLSWALICEREEAGFLAGYQAAELKAKMEFAAKYDHNSPLQVIAAEYVKRRGTTGPLALFEENRFIDGYEAGLHALQPQWISVKDRLPEYDQLALLWQLELQAQFVGRRRDSGIMLPLYYWECTSDFFESWKEIYHPKLMNENAITHWMPLPKPPTKEEA
jgi:hypothetical protein